MEKSLSAITLAQVVAFANFLCIIIALIKIKYLTKPLKIFALYIFITLVITLLIFGFVEALKIYNVYLFFLPFLTYFKIQDTSFLNILYYLNNSILLGLFYNSILKNISTQKKQKIFLLFIFIPLIEIIIYFFIDGVNKPGNINPVIDSLFCITLPVIYLWNWYQDESSLLTKVHKNPYFLLSTGLILQNLLSFIYFLTLEKIFQTDPSSYELFTSIKSFVQLISIYFFLSAFYYARYAKLIDNRSSTV